MSYSSTFTATGLKHSLHVEFIGGAYALEIALQDECGKRMQSVRIPLDDFEYPDLMMFSSYIHANIASMDPDEMEYMSGVCFDDDDDEEESV